MYKAGAFTDNIMQTKEDLGMGEKPRRQAYGDHNRQRPAIKSSVISFTRLDELYTTVYPLARLNVKLN